jgi:hypothetical protein
LSEGVSGLETLVSGLETLVSSTKNTQSKVKESKLKKITADGLEINDYLMANANSLYRYAEPVINGAPKIAAEFHKLLRRRAAEGNPIESWKPYLFKWLAGHGNLDSYQPKDATNPMVEFFKNE